MSNLEALRYAAQKIHRKADEASKVAGSEAVWGLLEDMAESAAYLDQALLDLQAIHPAAGEPKAEFFVEFETLRKAMSIYGLAAPASNSELGALMERYAVELIEAVADRPFPAPPAAAHGDGEGAKS